MSKTFPTVGIVAAGGSTRLFSASADSLGIDLVDLSGLSYQMLLEKSKECDLVTLIDGEVAFSTAKSLEAAGVTVRPSWSSMQISTDGKLTREKLDRELYQPDGKDSEKEIVVTVARSPHGQATTWSSTELVRTRSKTIMSITPPRDLSVELQEKAQVIALDTAKSIGLIGVMSLNLNVLDQRIFITNIDLFPHNSGNWTVDGSVTNQYEQHLRAILDLPLGDPSMRTPFVVTGNVYPGEKQNMYRPYLHLMARTPSLKFHQYRNISKVDELMGHVTLAGDDLSFLIDEVNHAIEYMQGFIEE